MRCSAIFDTQEQSSAQTNLRLSFSQRSARKLSSNNRASVQIPSRVMTPTIATNRIDGAGRTTIDKVDQAQQTSIHGATSAGGEVKGKPKYTVGSFSSEFECYDQSHNTGNLLLHMGAQFDKIDVNIKAEKLSEGNPATQSHYTSSIPVDPHTKYIVWYDRDVKIVREPWVHLRVGASNPGEDIVMVEEKIAEICQRESKLWELSRTKICRE